MPDDPALVPRPPRGRVFEASRPVRLGDASPAGRVRLDAVARYLQDVSSDDTADSGFAGAEAWVVRRSWIEVDAFPAYQERLRIATWCSGTGGHWAERRVSMWGDRGGRVEAAVLWVHVDPGSGRPKRVPAGFHDVYGEAARGRRVTAKALHAPRPPDGTVASAWPLRFCDFDLLEHVNNAAYWVPVEEALAARRELRAPLRAELEHRAPLERGAQPAVVVDDAGAELAMWIIDGNRVSATAVLRTRR